MPVPEPERGQILIKVSAAGVNRHDCLQRSAGRHPKGNRVPGLEASGVVVAVGAGVTEHKVGDRVMSLLQGGGYGEFALADVPVVLPVPQGLSDVEAAGIPEALFTAWWNFFGLMAMKPGETALIHGGASGVGHLALQALSALGYKVFATAGDPKKIEASKRFGAADAFDYDNPDLAQLVLKANDMHGIDALLDMSAGAHVEQDIDMMAVGGRIAHLSPGGGATLRLPLYKLMEKRVSVTGSLLRPLDLTLKAAVAKRLRREVLPLLGGAVRPHVHAVFGLGDAAEAHREMEQGGHIGKIILRVD